MRLFELFDYEDEEPRDYDKFWFNTRTKEFQVINDYGYDEHSDWLPCDDYDMSNGIEPIHQCIQKGWVRGGFSYTDQNLYLEAMSMRQIEKAYEYYLENEGDVDGVYYDIHRPRKSGKLNT